MNNSHKSNIKEVFHKIVKWDRNNNNISFICLWQCYKSITSYWINNLQIYFFIYCLQSITVKKTKVYIYVEIPWWQTIVMMINNLLFINILWTNKQIDRHTYRKNLLIVLILWGSQVKKWNNLYIFIHCNTMKNVHLIICWSDSNDQVKIK